MMSLLGGIASKFFNDSKRQLQELEVEDVNVKDEKKALIGALKAL